MSIVKRFAVTYAVVWAFITGTLARESNGSVFYPTDEDIAVGIIGTTVPMVAYELVVPVSRKILHDQNIVVEVVGATAITTVVAFASGSTTDPSESDDRVYLAKVGFVTGLVITIMYGIVRRVGR